MKCTERAMDRLKIQAGFHLHFINSVLLCEENIPLEYQLSSILDRNTSIISKITIYATSHIEKIKRRKSTMQKRKESTGK